ncbi:bifunctional DNA primase/polymerase [Mycolicibacterium sp. ND9-15]|uniref:bifunctional DNA primase/polymerase n=1 Tax=Mycolicibacterium sp. ND9-15 TaxID=3042320 RepID=UPI002DDB4D71|nr:bifunctional DNA primase/polymerase [Mycolicibacterium sp. ND9-15]WSE57526.1 bifunctional DNA primase/polymerase [Mycolicibacterium sp. ND9-15]
MPAMKYLRFYLDRGCVVVPGYGKTKNTRKGCGGWTVEATRRNVSMLMRNAKVINGSGRLLIVDVDPKNGGSVDALRRRFPDLPETRTVRTSTPHPAGFGTHLLFTIPSDVRLSGRRLCPGIDIPHSVLLPGSVVTGADGVDRKYELTNDLEPAPAPLGLLAAVDKGEIVGLATEASTGDADDRDEGRDDDDVVARLVERFGDAPGGSRNDVFTEVAPIVIRLKGAEGADMLMAAYLGEDESWIQSAVKSALEKYGDSAAPGSLIRRSKYVGEALLTAWQSGRFGTWRGRTGSTDRKVFLAVVQRCRDGQTMTTVASVRTLALLTGLEPKTVSAALERLVKSGRLCAVGTAEDGSQEYAPVVGEMTTVVSKEMTPPRESSVDPLHVVWTGDGLKGRHSQVFDLVSVGVRRASEIAKAGGMSLDAAREALAVLVDTGLLEREDRGYSLPSEIEGVADRLAVSRGAVARKARLAGRIEEERSRPRGDAPPDEGPAIYEDDERRRREEEDELMRQLGIL